MTTKKIAAVAALLTAALASPTFAAGKACKASFTSNGNMHLTKYGALKSAREVWQAQVRAQYGAEFSSWGKSKSPSSSCEKANVFYNYTCQVTAKPCK